MRIGLMMDIGQEDLQGAVEDILRAEQEAFHTVWVPHVLALDALTILAVAGQTSKKIGLGTAVVPIQPRHPSALAQQALSTAETCEGRFSLGIGLSHKLLMEDMLGLNYSKPAAHMREYLQVLIPLLRGRAVDFKGAHYQVRMELQHKPRRRIELLVAALGPLMLSLAGEMAAGTITWMTGPRTLEQHIIPRLHQAAAPKKRAQLRVVAGFPVLLTRNREQSRAALEKQLKIYGQLPSYQAMLEREGVQKPSDIALVGDEAELRRQLLRLKDIGVSELEAWIPSVDEEAERRTRAFLSAERDIATS